MDEILYEVLGINRKTIIFLILGKFGIENLNI